MSNLLSAVRGALAGLNDAAGNTQTAGELNEANERARQAKMSELRTQIAPHGMAIQGLQQKLQTIDPEKNPNEYNATVDEIQDNIHAMREILHPDAKLGAGDWLKMHTTDRLHITNHDQRVRDVAAKNAAGVAQDEEEAQAIAKGQTPYNQTPDYLSKQALEQQRLQGEIQVAKTREAATTEARRRQDYAEFLAQHPGYKGTFEQWVAEQGAEGRAQHARPVKSGLVKTPQSPTGWAGIWVNPYQPGKVIGFTPTTPSRWYIGYTTNTTTKDPFGVESTTEHVINPGVAGALDLSGLQQFSDEGAAMEPGPSLPAAVAQASGAPIGPKTRQLQSVRARTTPAESGPKQLDANGHIPEADEKNSMLREAANQLLDGMDINKLNVPARDKQMVAELAQKYGWEQGKFTPREISQVNESRSLIASMSKDPKIMGVYNEGSIKRGVISHIIKTPDEKGMMGSIKQALTARTLNENDIAFIQNYRQLIGRIQGIASLTRGAGRPTEQAIKRMIGELPDPAITDSPAAAQRAFDLVNNEIEIGLQTGDWTGKQGGQKTQQLRQIQRNGSVSDEDILNGLNKLAQVTQSHGESNVPR